MKKILLLGLFGAMAAVHPMTASNAEARSSARAEAPALKTQTTEEGQTVAFDAYSWQRRELAKRLPLSEPWPSEGAIAAQFKRFSLDKGSAAQLIAAPSKIATDVYLVNSEPNHSYLIDAGPDGLILVDPGLESNVEAILKNVEALGYSRGAIKWVLNTHAHFDHSMADAHFQRLGAKILVGRADAAAVEKATVITAKIVLPPAVQAGYPTVKVDWPLDDGEELMLGNKKLTAIATPGHTEGSTCFLLNIDGKNILFGGDTVLFDYRLGAQGPFADNHAYLASLKKLAAIGGFVRWDMLLPGHGAIVLDRASLDIMKAARQVQLDLDNGTAIDALPFADDYYRQYMFGRP